MAARSGQPGRTAPIAADRDSYRFAWAAQPRSMVWFSWPCGRVGRAAGAAQIHAPRSTATSASASPCPSYTAALDVSGGVGRLVRLAVVLSIRRAGSGSHLFDSCRFQRERIRSRDIRLRPDTPDGLDCAPRPSGVLGSGRKLLDRATQKAALRGLHPRDKNPEAEKSIA
jgi:hypothetical protein